LATRGGLDTFLRVRAASSESIMNQVLDYFTGQLLALQIFYTIGLVAALLLLVQIGLFFLGFDGHHDFDPSHMDGSVGFVSLRSMVAFFVGFGWTGVIAYKAGWGVGGATAAAFGAGLILMALMYSIIRLLYAQRSSGNIRMENAIGNTGRVYLSIPASGATGGQVQITFQGQMQTLPALTKGADPIPTGTAVIVRETIPPDTLIVEKL
jgi:membrane protein implicated in regulation of membrane protease activity